MFPFAVRIFFDHVVAYVFDVLVEGKQRVESINYLQNC